MRSHGVARAGWMAGYALIAMMALAWPHAAFAQVQVKPRFVIMIDTSGSMSSPTGGGNNSCGQPRTRINDAECVLGRLNDSYGDITFALGRFKQTTCSGSCNWGTDNCGSTPGGSADRGQMLVPLGDQNQVDIGKWVDFVCSGCTTSTAGANNPELDPGGATPLTGIMHAARRYLQGSDPDYPGDPIAADSFSSCRPYRVILLTDGQVNCAGETQATTVTSIKELRRAGTPGVPEGVMPVDVRSDFIGFGVAPGDPDIEAYAQAGGRPDGPGNEGFYASDEASLALAFSQIIQGSLLVELCNGVDDNCNGLIDEGFNLGTPCDGPDTDLCLEGVMVCTSPNSSGCNDFTSDNIEVCNGIDDNCNGLIDEPPANCPACTFNPEICDGIDNNCNNMIDEGLSRPCGASVGACTAGTETCVMGSWVGCTATFGSAETCNNVDDDCDGAVDGITQACGNPPVGQCQPGQRVCTSGSFGSCVGGIGPSPEGCDGIDNNCNGMIDEGVPGLGQPCGTLCGQGTTQCVNGMVVCVGGSPGGVEVCNNVDDNCNGMIDEGLPSMGSCMTSPSGEPLCTPGELKCVGGTYQCVGGQVSQPEICDCKDNNCNSQVDEGNLCGPGATCLGGSYCQCALPCDPGEFPCPEGYHCSDPTAPPAGFCVRNKCFGVDCQPTPTGAATVCVDGTCVPACDLANCGAALVCRPSDGQCVQDNCNGFPERCSAGQFCVDGTCIDDPCRNVSCSAPEYCVGGSCARSCAGIVCPAEQLCVMGACQPSLCAGVFCPMYRVCDPGTGACLQDQCLGSPNCPSGQACDPLTGGCVQDPCLGVHCPGSDEVCRNGSCYDPGQLTPPDDTTRTHVSAAGSGCACQTGTRDGGGRVPGASLALLVGAAALLVRGRRRPEVH